MRKRKSSKRRRRSRRRRGRRKKVKGKGWEEEKYSKTNLIFTGTTVDQKR